VSVCVGERERDRVREREREFTYCLVNLNFVTANIVYLINGIPPAAAFVSSFPTQVMKKWGTPRDPAGLLNHHDLLWRSFPFVFFLFHHFIISFSTPFTTIIQANQFFIPISFSSCTIDCMIELGGMSQTEERKWLDTEVTS